MSKRKHMSVQQEVAKKTAGSSFTQFCVTTVGCILIAATGFTFTMFATDTIGVPTQSTIKSSQEIDTPRTYSISYRDIEKEKDKPNLGGVGDEPYNPQIPGVDPDDPIDPGDYVPPEDVDLTVSADGNKVIEILKSPEYQLNGNFMVDVDEYGYVYDKLKAAGLSDEFSLGVIANISSEGTAGMMQGTYASITQSQAAAADFSGGVGFMQWTYKPFKRYICAQYINNNAFDGNGNLIKSKAVELETKFLIDMCTGNVDFGPYGGGTGGQYYNLCKGHANTVREFAEAFCDVAEKPGGSCATAYNDKMRYCKGVSPAGSCCKTRVDRAGILVNKLNTGS